jgi:hypothetical protein
MDNIHNTGDCWDDVLTDLTKRLQDITKEQNELVQLMVKNKKVSFIDDDYSQGVMTTIYTLVTLHLKLIQDLKNLEQVLSVNHSIYSICQN